MADGRRRPWAPRKRRSTSAGGASDDVDEGVEMVALEQQFSELTEFTQALMSPVQSRGVYNMREEGDKEASGKRASMPFNKASPPEPGSAPQS